MATMASEDPSDRADTSISSSINSSQSSSTFRGTEDLLGGFRSRPRTPSNANTNAVRYVHVNNFLEESRLSKYAFFWIFCIHLHFNGIYAKAAAVAALLTRLPNHNLLILMP